MEDTPITVLEKQIKTQKSFIRRLETREGIVPNSSESPEETKKKFDKIIHDYRVKVSQFEAAIEILKENKQWEKATVIQM